MHGKRLSSLWPMAVLLAAMIAVVGLATVLRADGVAGADKAGPDGARPTIALKASPVERPKVGH